MTQETLPHHRSVATFIHLSTFSKYLIPFGNFIFPLLLWVSQRKKSAFIDDHGRGALNFQMSMLIYNLVVIFITVPLILWQSFEIADLNLSFYDLEEHFERFVGLSEVSVLVMICIIAALVLLALFIFQLFAVISAAVSASRGAACYYPLCIPFIGPELSEGSESNTVSSAG